MQYPKTLLNCCHLLTFALTCTVAPQLLAQYPLPLHEPFPASYTNAGSALIQVPQGGANYPGVNLAHASSTSINVWTIGGSPGGGSAQMVGGPACLTYPGLYTGPGSVGLYIRTNNTTATRSRGILYTTTSSGSIYNSFLLKVEQTPSETDPVGPGVARLFAKLDNATSGNGSAAMAGVWVTVSNTLAVSKSSNSSPTADTGFNLGAGTHLIVMRYTWNPELDDDEVAVWIDPGSLGLPEGSVPAPTLTTTTGADVVSFSSFYIYHIGSEVSASLFVDEIRVGTTWADVTPTAAPCFSANVVTEPVDATVNEGISATFSILAGGSSPTFQWQSSSDNGATWNNVTGGSGATSLSYTTPPLFPVDTGKQFRCLVNVSCNNSSATSQVATVTVNAATPTANGVVLNDIFNDSVHNDPPVTAINSVWYASTAGSLDSSTGTNMMGFPASGSSRLWLGYFTDDPATPVHLALGKQIKVTLDFSAAAIVASGGALRMGVYDYADGATRVSADGFGTGSSGNGVNVRGYMVSIPFAQAFFSDSPFTIYARNLYTSGDLMGTTGAYESLGSGASGVPLNGSAAFLSDVPYRLEFTIARTNQTAVRVTTKFSGNGTNWTHSVVDSTYAYHRFDAFGIRPNNLETTAENFTFTNFKVEVLDAEMPPPSPIPLNVTSSGGNVTLTWTDPAFTLESAPEASGTYTNVPNANSPYTVPASQVRQFFRLKTTY